MWSDVDADKMPPGPRGWDMIHGNGVIRCGHGVIPENAGLTTDPAWRVGLLTRGLLLTRGSVESACKFGIARMTRGKQKIEAQKRSAERNEKPKGSQIEARNAGLKTVCSVCKAPLANYKQLVDHFGSKHPKETVPPGPSS